jgi:hypothetical protein
MLNKHFTECPCGAVFGVDRLGEAYCTRTTSTMIYRYWGYMHMACLSRLCDAAMHFASHRSHTTASPTHVMQCPARGFQVRFVLNHYGHKPIFSIFLLHLSARLFWNVLNQVRHHHLVFFNVKYVSEERYFSM